MFRKLCGETTLRNVVVVTNMWGEVDPKVGEAREAELMTDDIFFKPVLDKGAQTARHENTVTSAQKIIRLFLDNHPIPLRIQVELVDEHKDISETGAGEELNREMNAQVMKHQEEMRVLREEIEQAMRDKDEETMRELEIETQKMQREIERFENDAKRFGSNYRKEKARVAARFTQMEVEGKRAAEEAAANVKAEGKRAAEEAAANVKAEGKRAAEEAAARVKAEARQEADRLAARYQQQIDKPEDSLRAGNAVSNLEKTEMRRKLDELQKAQARTSTPVPINGIPPRQSSHIFTRLGAFIDKWFMPI